MPGILSIFYGDEVGMEGLGNLSNRKPFPWDNIDKDMINLFTSVGKIRVSQDFLQRADLNLLKVNRDYIMFERTTEEEKALIAINRTEKEIDFEVPKEYEHAEPIYTLKKSRKGHLTPRGAVALKTTA